MKLTPYLSTKFKHLSVLATMAVVILHSRTFRWSGVHDWTDTVQEQIAQGCAFAVPTFLVISGFLFISSFEKYGWGGLLKRRFWSLYVPMVLWMIISELLVWPAKCYTGESVSPAAFVGAPFLLYEKFSVCFHFWYVRALIIAFLIAPVLYWLTRTAVRAWIVFVLWTGLCATCSVPVLHIGPYCFQHVVDSGQFLLLGMCLARTEYDFCRIRVPLCLVSLICIPLAWSHPFWLRLAEFLFVWSAYDILAHWPWRNVSPRLLMLLNHGYPLFFVYCAHTTVIKYLSGIGRLALGTEPWAKMLGFAIHTTSFWFCLALAFAVRRIVPRIYAVLTGGR